MTDSQQNPPTRYSDELDLRELFRALWDGKWLIGGVMLAAAVIAVIVTLMMPNIYRAEALLAPNDQDGAGGLTALTAQYGSLASLAGINLGGGATDSTALALEVLKSRKFISEFIERHDILVPLMAADGWDPGSNELKVDSDDYNVDSGEWVRNVSFPRKTIPSLQEAYETFMENFSASQDKKSGFVTISIEHYSPTVAKHWVDWLIEDLNATIMKKDVAEAEQAIAYLNEQIKNTSLAEMQNLFFRLIEEQMKTVVLAKVTDEYSFKILDPAIAPEEKSKPRRALIIVVSVILSGLFAVFLTLVRSLPRIR